MKLFTFREHLKHRRSFTPDEYSVLQSRLISARRRNVFPHCWRKLWELFRPVEEKEIDKVSDKVGDKARSALPHFCFLLSAFYFAL